MQPPALLRSRVLSAVVAAWSALAVAGLVRAQWVEPGVTSLLTIPGSHAGDLFGWAIRVIPDVDLDQVDEIAVTAPFHRTAVYGEGRLALVSGRTGQVLWNVFGSATGGIFGATLATIRDLDGDGRVDLVVGQPYAPAGGLVRIVSSRTGQVLRTLNSPASSGSFGYAVATDGDVDGDGADDIVVAATNDNSNGSNAGRLYVFSPTGALLRTIDRPLASVVEFGCQIEFVADIDGDGRDELCVGARQAGSLTAGFLYLLQPRANGVQVAWTAAGFNHGTSIQGDLLITTGDVGGDGIGDLYLGEPSASRGRVIDALTGQVLRTFVSSPSEWAGDGAMLDDVNHDGIADLAYSGKGYAANGQFSGRLYVHSGRDGRLLHTMTSLMTQSSFGATAAMFSDRDGDGARELVVSAPGGTQWGMGRVFVMRGEPCLAGRRLTGSGAPGTNGLPALDLAADPVLGTMVDVQVGSCAPAPTLALLVLGLQPAALPLPQGPVLSVQPDATALLSLPPSGAAQPLTIPLDRALCGMPVLAQSLVADGGASGGIAASRVLTMTIGG